MGLSITGARVGWLLRAVEMPFVLTFTFVTASEPFDAPVLALIGAGVLAWLVSLVLWRWDDDDIPDSPLLLALLVVIAATTGLASLVAGNYWIDALMLVACLQSALLLSLRATLVPLAGAAAVLTAWLAFDAGGATTLVMLALIGGFYTGGLARGLRTAQLRAAQAGQADRERAAALAERTRIAREIHDILAHSLADLSIQLELADALLTDGGDTTGARDRVRHAHRLAADGLNETRQAVHALRHDVPPLPDALAALAGGDTVLDVTGRPRQLPAAAGLALLRTAQEALSNARRHLAGPAQQALLAAATRAGPGRTPPSLGLTDRETELLELIVDGLSNREIALRLHISNATVKTHVNHIFTKLGVTSRSAAIAKARPAW